MLLPVLKPEGNFWNWKAFEPRTLRPDSMEPRNAATVVITPMTENTPIVMPDMVRIDRSLFTASEPMAIRRISESRIGKEFTRTATRRPDQGGRRPRPAQSRR